MYMDAVQDGYSDPSIEYFRAVNAESNEIIGYFVLAWKQPAKEASTDYGSKGAQSIPKLLNPGLPSWENS